MRMLSLHGISHDAWNRYSSEGSWYYEVADVGYKYNLTDIAASLGLAQLKRANAFATARRRIAEAYTEGFAELPEIRTPFCAPGKQAIEGGPLAVTKAEPLHEELVDFIEALRQNNIGASVHFIPLHLHPFYRRTFGYRPEDFPNALAAYRRIVSLPIYPNMTATDVEDVVGAVTNTIETSRR